MSGVRARATGSDGLPSFLPLPFLCFPLFPLFPFFSFFSFFAFSMFQKHTFLGFHVKQFPSSPPNGCTGSLDL